MVTPVELLITQHAHEVIIRGVRDGQRSGLECGGSLLVHDNRERPLVAYALPPGPSAERSPARVVTDASYQNDAIQRITRVHPRLAYAGDWHVHPTWMPVLSMTDRNTAAAILRGEARHREYVILLLGTARASARPIVVGFLARQGGLEAEIETVVVRRVPDDAPQVQRALGGSLVPWPMANGSSRPDPDHHRFPRPRL